MKGIKFTLEYISKQHKNPIISNCLSIICNIEINLKHIDYRLKQKKN